MIKIVGFSQRISSSISLSIKESIKKITAKDRLLIKILRDLALNNSELETSLETPKSFKIKLTAVTVAFWKLLKMQFASVFQNVFELLMSFHILINIDWAAQGVSLSVLRYNSNKNYMKT